MTRAFAFGRAKNGNPHVLQHCLMGAFLIGALASSASFRLEAQQASSNGCDRAAIKLGRDIWFKSTFGDEKYYVILAQLPNPAQRILIGFTNVLLTPRSQRFDKWGVINDPGCRANPGGGFDICDDPHGTGVIGIRQIKGPKGEVLFGIACAVCHAGFSPLNPPKNPNEPKWENIHPTIGNQYGRFGDIFAANLSSNDPRVFMLRAWPRGTVDTTLLENDNIMNPGVVTAFWEQKHRLTFDVDTGTPEIRSGQGGEDDLGGLVAAERVYTNIGVCFSECTAKAIASGKPIDPGQCRAECPDFPSIKELNDLVAFMRSIDEPKYPEKPTAKAKYEQGERVFEATCQSCHDNHGQLRHVLSNDAVIPLVADPPNTTNACRSLTTNWEGGHIWANFSSQVYKDRIAAGDRGYRVMPLAGIWATEPFLHNQSIGSWAPATASPQERAEYYRAAMWELLKPERTPKVNRLPVALGPFPAGTPLTYVYSRDPGTGALLCDDIVENRGHHYGSELSDTEKDALIYWLLFQ